MTHKIHQGDALEILKTMPDQSVDCIVTGPPYHGERLASDDPRTIGGDETPGEYLAQLVPVFAECYRLLKQLGSCFVMVRGDEIAKGFISRLDGVGLGLEARTLIYEDQREHLLMFRCKDRPLCHFDFMDPFYDWGWREDTCTRSATMSPRIVAFCILISCPEDGTILDPFAGTGMTISTAISMGRNAIGIEIAPSQIALIEKRMELLDTQVLERR